MPKSKKRTRMHPRNVFNKPPDYTDLAIKYKNFRDVCTLNLAGKAEIDFKNEQSLRMLTNVLLKEYFQLDMDIAPNFLVPTLPLRLNYILWMEDLLEQLKPKPTLIKGIDIGCGSSCIYSIVAAKKNNWHMYALETNDINISFAQNNVTRNNLQEFVTIFRQTNVNVIFDDFIKMQTNDVNFTFCLCNPPFYDAELSDPFGSTTRNPDKRLPPRNCRTGFSDELTFKGGEVQFVTNIIKESVTYQSRIKIFTTMMGRKGNLKLILEVLKSNNINNFCTTEFHQGNTTRWGIAWSFANDINLREKIERNKNESEQSKQ